MTASTWRGVGTAVLPVAALGVLTLVIVLIDAPDMAALGDVEAGGPSSGAPLGVLLLTLAALALRNVAPSLVLIVVVLATVVSSVGDEALVVQMIAAALASYTVGDRASDRLRSALLVLGVAAWATVSALMSESDPVDALVIPFVVLVPAWLLGDVVRTRRIEALSREADARRAQRDLELELRSSVAEERRRVSRELHDIVAHTVSVMVVQAGAARKVVERSPERADGALAAVEATGREAMAELRQLLGALGGADESAGVAPQPGVAELAALVERVRRAGLAARIEIDGDTQPLPAPVDVAAYRIVQEALTNALRYAGGARTVVRLWYEPSQLRIEVSDDGPSTSATSVPGTGRGLVGMIERAKLIGGRLEAGPRRAGGFTVRAWLPVGGASP
jgi:signal transduction histidine kinase